MRRRVIVSIAASMAALISAPGLSLAQTWDSAGLPQSAFGPSQTTSAPAPRRDLSGIWDAGSAGISGPGHVASPFTPWSQEKLKEMKPGNGPRAVTEQFINDPLNTMCDPAGFPRIALYELRPTQIVQTPNQVLILYMYEKRWRVVWTDGRQLPKDPDPRWYGYQWAAGRTTIRSSFRQSAWTREPGSIMRAIRIASICVSRNASTA